MPILDDIAAAFEPGFRAIYKNIWLRAELEKGLRKAETCRRSVGQLFKVKKAWMTTPKP